MIIDTSALLAVLNREPGADRTAIEDAGIDSLEADFRGVFDLSKDFGRLRYLLILTISADRRGPYGIVFLVPHFKVDKVDFFVTPAETGIERGQNFDIFEILRFGALIVSSVGNCGRHKVNAGRGQSIVS